MSKMFVSLFDKTGIMAKPWAEAGYTCYCFDIHNQERTEKYNQGSITYVRADLRSLPVQQQIKNLKPVFLAGFPPCDDLAVSGAKHFAGKAALNPKFQQEAVELALIVEQLGDAIGCPWFFENPVSVLSTLHRPPDFTFNPNYFGGYLPEDDVHPIWPKYIAPRDAYWKETCLWVGGDFKFPPLKVVPHEQGWNRQTRLLGGKSLRTKTIRSATPRGFALAVFLANS